MMLNSQLKALNCLVVFLLQQQVMQTTVNDVINKHKGYSSQGLHSLKAFVAMRLFGIYLYKVDTL